MQAMEMPQSAWPDMTFDIPFGAGDPFPAWPTVTDHPKKFVISYLASDGERLGNSSRFFMANRDGGGKFHVGLDIYGNPGDPIVAMENGVIVKHYDFYHGTDALIVQCDSGLVINYGEVASKSWKEFGLSKGSRVQKGRPIARVGQMSGGKHMLHFETYMPPTDRNKKYYGGDPGPILNPTYYLLRARFVAGAGRAFAGSSCFMTESPLSSIPANLRHIAIEDERVGEAPGDSVLGELLSDTPEQAAKDMADGP